jgi:hypothetical protein
MLVQETNSPSFQQLSQEMKQKRALHNKPHKTGRKGYHGKKERVGVGGCKASCGRKTKPLGPIS